MAAFNSVYSRIMKVESLRRQSIISLLTTIMLTVIGFISTMYFAHTVGASILGAYFLFVAYYNVFKLLSEGGLNIAATKRISEGKEKNEYFSALVSIRIFLLIVSAIIILVFRNFFDELDISHLLGWLLVALVVGVFWTSVATGLYGSGKVGINQICGFISSGGKIVFQIVAIYLGFQAGGLAAGFVLGMAVAAVFGVRFLDYRFVRFTKKHLHSLFAFSLWIFLAASGSFVYEYADTILIGYFLNNADVGIYRVALQLSSGATFITIAMKTVLYPKMSNWSANNKFSPIETALSKGITYSLLLAVPVFTGGIILGDQMLYFFYGEDFAKASVTLTILLAVQIVNVFMFLQNTCLNAVDKPRETFKVTLAAASANILMDILLIPHFNILGAAIATFITMSVNAILSYRLLSNVITLKMESESVMNIMKSAFLMGILLAVYRIYFNVFTIWILIFLISAGGIIYVLLLLRFDANIRKEVKDVAEQLGIKNLYVI